MEPENGRFIVMAFQELKERREKTRRPFTMKNIRTRARSLRRKSWLEIPLHERSIASEPDRPLHDCPDQPASADPPRADEHSGSVQRHFERKGRLGKK